jgi:hypothetical protein
MQSKVRIQDDHNIGGPFFSSKFNSRRTAFVDASDASTFNILDLRPLINGVTAATHILYILSGFTLGDAEDERRWP